MKHSAENGESRGGDGGVGEPPFHCLLCGYRGHTLRGIRAHIRTHNLHAPEDQYIANGLGGPRLSPNGSSGEEEMDNKHKVYNCDLCSYNSTHKGNIVRHFRLAHPTAEPAEIIPDANENIQVKQEPEEAETQQPAPDPVPVTTATTVPPPPPLRKAGAKHCKSCDISFTYLSSFIAHKKYYCASHATETNTNNNNDSSKQ